MNTEEQTVIEDLFGKLKQAGAQSGPRDIEAERLIGDLVQRQPAAPYLMAWALLVQDDTLDRLIERMGLSGQERFTPALQDRMARVLAGDAGLGAWQSGRLSTENFAHRLSKVWAGLPADASGRSYHEGKAGNRARVGWNTVPRDLGATRWRYH